MERILMKLTKGYTSRLFRILELTYSIYEKENHKINRDDLLHELLVIKSHVEIMITWIELSRKAEE